ncbi:hypothetical protein GCM10027344_22960 [Spelaeicoccus albus]
MTIDPTTVTTIMSAPTAARLEPRKSIMSVIDMAAPSIGIIESMFMPPEPSGVAGGFSTIIGSPDRVGSAVRAGRWSRRTLIARLEPD